jgi:hypothetical protein
MALAAGSERPNSRSGLSRPAEGRGAPVSDPSPGSTSPRSPKQRRRRTNADRLVLCSVALGLSSGLASAEPVVPGGEPFTYLEAEAGEVCPFPVTITAVADQSVRTTLPNGVQVITGPATATVTNMTTLEQATYNISCPGFYDPATGRLTLVGQSLIVQTVDVGEPFLITTSGRVGFIVNQPIDEPLRGHVSHDICAELA